MQIYWSTQSKSPVTRGVLNAVKIFDVDNMLATASIDRLMHHGEALVIQGESYRTRDKDGK